MPTTHSIPLLGTRGPVAVVGGRRGRCPRVARRVAAGFVAVVAAVLVTAFGGVVAGLGPVARGTPRGTSRVQRTRRGSWSCSRRHPRRRHRRERGDRPAAGARRPRGGGAGGAAGRVGVDGGGRHAGGASSRPWPPSTSAPTTRSSSTTPGTAPGPTPAPTSARAARCSRAPTCARRSSRAARASRSSSPTAAARTSARRSCSRPRASIPTRSATSSSAHRGLVDVTAASRGQVAVGDKALGGVFTQALMRAVHRHPRATLDADHDGVVAWTEAVAALRVGHARHVRDAPPARARGRRYDRDRTDAPRVRRARRARARRIPPSPRRLGLTTEAAPDARRSSRCSPGTPAAWMGIRVGEHVIEVRVVGAEGGEDARPVATPADLVAALQAAGPGGIVVVVLRDPTARPPRTPSVRSS